MSVEQQLSQDRKASTNMRLNLCVLGKVNHMLQTVAADHDLSLNYCSCFNRRCLSVMQNLIVHLANVRTDFEVAEDLAELGDTLNDQSTDSL